MTRRARRAAGGSDEDAPPAARRVFARGPLASLAAHAALAALGCRGTNGASHETTSVGEEAVPIVTTCPPAARDAVRAGGVRVLRGVAYAAPAGDTLRLDLALPPGDGPHPVVLLLHGGGWEGGGRESMGEEMRVLAARGYAAATASYRLTRAPMNVFPAAVQDVRCAVRWLRAQGSTHGLDGRRIGVLGFSAGAHLASMLGTTAEVAALDAPEDGAPEPGCLANGGDPNVQAVVSVAGPQDLRVRGPYTREQARLVTNFLGIFPGEAPGIATLASPIAHVGARSAPFLLVQGARDDLVTPDHARRMRDALQAVGRPATLLELRDVGHSFPALEGSDHPEVGCTTFAFLERWLRGG